jgi:hypothetical protein
MTMNEEIESMIDGHRVCGMLRMMAGVCFEKAEHVQTNWQDTQLARSWERDATLLLKLAERVSN